MQAKHRFLGAGVAAALAAGFGIGLLTRHDDEPDFETVQRDGAVTVRDYPELLVAETVQAGSREAAFSCGVVALSDYLDGQDRLSPVLADGDEDGRGWRTRFVMPVGATPETLPMPEDGIGLCALNARRVAALRFSGEADDDQLAGQEAELRAWIHAHGYRPIGPVELALYHSPLTPAPLRRNEVLIPVAA